MKVTQFAVNELVFYHPIVSGDTIQLEMTQVTANVAKTVNPIVQIITDNWFKCQFTTVTGQTQENLTGGTIYLAYDGYYDYKLKKNGTTIEESQFFMDGPVQAVMQVSGTTGYVVTNPYAGSSGSSGASGSSGVPGTAGSSGANGTSGQNGTSGLNGTSGQNGTNGQNGSSGSSGLSGTNGESGTNGLTGTSGISGSNGVDGSSGQNGTNGLTGSSGSSGQSGTNGVDGSSGTNGLNGTNGESGSSGSSGQNGLSASYYNYKTHTNSQAPPLGSGTIEWNNATQTGSTELYVSHLTRNNDDIEVILASTGIGSRLIIQDQTVSENYQIWTVTSVAVTVDSHVTFSVTYVGGGYSFANNSDIIVIVQSVGLSGSSGTSGANGSSGSNGATGSSGSSGITGSSGSSGASLAAITEDSAYSNGSNVFTNNAGIVDSLFYAIQYPAVYFQTAIVGFNSATNSFSGYTNSFAVSSPIEKFINSKKLKSIKINRIDNLNPIPTGKTECVTVSAYLKIYKGTVATSGAFSYALAKTIDLDGLINFNISGSTATVEVDLSTDNIQTAYNEYIFASIERTTEICNSTSKLINMPGVSLFFETVASGILGTNGTAGSSGTNGSSGSTGATGSSGSSGASGTNGLTALGAASKGGSVSYSGFTYNATTTNWDYDVVFSTPFANTNYSISISLNDINVNNQPEPYNINPIWSSEKSVSGFTINSQQDPGGYGSDAPRVEWLAVSQGETGVSGAPGSSGTSGSTGATGSSGSSGATGSSGSSGANGTAGPAGTSGTSAGGGASAPILVTGVTLNYTGWTYNAPHFEYTYTNANIETNKVVDFTPYNASLNTCIINKIYPYVLTASGSCKFYADYAPNEDITGDVLITTTQ